ncbi:FecR domain-containing protein [Arenibacter sp. F26102]|uniref:FecR domain-containing protein n=1 Tax=Arenibacter sp. F26102 TaxID=2926416 RepID=UPI001FF24FA4|nr:FecR domain-containing protein [Arenibacter sp. F26102]MCK0148196.1 FecR domain-containing protein [Arenibacter sp. F26102]
MAIKSIEKPDCRTNVESREQSKLRKQYGSAFVSSEVYMNVSKGSIHPFIANAGELSARVLDTQFNVSAYPEDGATEVVLAEGSVSLTSDFINSDN